MKLNEILRKYPKTNNEWGLHTYNFGNSTSLGKRISWMYNELIFIIIPLVTVIELDFYFNSRDCRIT